MQKKIIALAVAAMASGAAFAQSNVTIYGIADVGVSMYSNNVTKAFGTRTGVDSGQSAGSRLGFRGTEDLGNGLKAVFVLEQGIAIDTGTNVGVNFGRQAYAGLAGGFGTVAFGRQYTPQHLFHAAVDPFGKGNVGNLGNVFMNDARLDNLAAYISPSFGGFSVVVGATRSAGGDESNGNKDGAGPLTVAGGVVTAVTMQDMRVWAIAPSYTNGPLFVAANIHRAQENRQNSGVEAVKVVDLMASYDFGMVKLGSAYGTRKHELSAANSDVNVKQWMLGATVPVSAKAKVMVSYNRRTTDFGTAFGLSDAKVGQLAIGAEYALSKRTSLYAGYAQQSQNTVQEALGIANSFVRASIGDADTAGLGYQKGFVTGMRHSF